MHPNPAFRTESAAENLAFAALRGFGIFTIDGAGAGPLAAHAPFVMDAAHGALEAHLVRSTPFARAAAAAGEEGAPALLAVSGPDAYISPDWYAAGLDQVPTWNYVAVHLRGRLRLAPVERLRPHLEALSAQYEARLAPKPPWRLEKMSESVYDRLARALTPVSLTIEAVEGTWKLNQNKPAGARAGAAEALAAAGPDAPGQERAALARLMSSAKPGR